MPPHTDRVQTLLTIDPWLTPYREALELRQERITATRNRILGNTGSLAAFATGHEYFGLHADKQEWVFREWAPNATRIFLIGEMNEWREDPAWQLQRINAHGVWEIRLPADAFSHRMLYRLRLDWCGGSGDRIPAWTRRVVQDPGTGIFNAQVWLPKQEYRWNAPELPPAKTDLLIYEVHPGMAQEAEKIGGWAEFTATILPRIVAAGYTAIQLMAVQEHPYYASFGYQISSFFAPSSRFGTPEDRKALVDAAHAAGLRVIMDVIHSHAVLNEVEGLSRFDGTDFQYFHTGSRGRHPAWNSRCFDYAKPEVLHFLLSNCRYWLDEFKFDGFRFDGVTSMLYLDHGLDRAFTSYTDYFRSVDEDGLIYCSLANELIHELRPQALTIAEDVSGMPGLALPREQGGTGFDFRFAMGIPDFWIRLAKEQRDETWSMSTVWHELTNRRPAEKSISYAESHDQALVGDQTLLFRMAGSEMYTHMHRHCSSLHLDRAIALHKMIRLITLTTAGSGYLNFMGNEFGHPEWIDFPRPENNWSYHYARRLWSLADHSDLKYRQLARFDRDMIAFCRHAQLLQTADPVLVYEHQQDQILAFFRADCLFVFNFHPTASRPDYPIEVPPGTYRLVLDSDHSDYAGHNRIEPDQLFCSEKSTTQGRPDASGHRIRLYLPTRTALILHKEQRWKRCGSSPIARKQRPERSGQLVPGDGALRFFQSAAGPFPGQPAHPGCRPRPCVRPSIRWTPDPRPEGRTT
ncbi:MAG: alpha amylase C-terminal domain-containing protein [Desulfohalobiaceae bacterium]|nr:alpha amylase C-terminal domain-containing protein [Desulfohalobiaceae bacterium]